MSKNYPINFFDSLPRFEFLVEAQIGDYVKKVNADDCAKFTAVEGV
jgi:hypothetical protein